MTVLPASPNTGSADFERNRAHNEALVRDLRETVAAVSRGGGERARAKHLGRGKLLVRDTPGRADPEIRQEIARLVEAITGGNRQLLRAAGGFDKAADRVESLRKLPDGAPTEEHRRAAIDRYSIGSTIRLVGPEADPVAVLVRHDTPRGAAAVSSGTMSLDDKTLKKGLEASMIRCPSVRRADGDQDRTVWILDDMTTCGPPKCP